MKTTTALRRFSFEGVTYQAGDEFKGSAAQVKEFEAAGLVGDGKTAAEAPEASATGAPKSGRKA